MNKDPWITETLAKVTPIAKQFGFRACESFNLCMDTFASSDEYVSVYADDPKFKIGNMKDRRELREFAAKQVSQALLAAGVYHCVDGSQIDITRPRKIKVRKMRVK